MIGIPYSCSNHLSSALTFNKYTCKSFLKQLHVLTPEASLVRKNIDTDLEAIADHVGFPCFVKPNSGGSSLGIAKVVKFEELQPALEEAMREDREVIVERYIKGREVTCGVFKSGGNSPFCLSPRLFLKMSSSTMRPNTQPEKRRRSHLPRSPMGFPKNARSLHARFTILPTRPELSGWILSSKATSSTSWNSTLFQACPGKVSSQSKL